MNKSEQGDRPRPGEGIPVQWGPMSWGRGPGGYLCREVQYIMGNGHMVPPPCAQNDRQTYTTENIIFPQLRLRVVTSMTLFRTLYEFCSNVVFHTVSCFETLKIPAASQENYRKVSTWNYRRTRDVERWVFVLLFWVAVTLVWFKICQF